MLMKIQLLAMLALTASIVSDARAQETTIHVAPDLGISISHRVDWKKSTSNNSVAFNLPFFGPQFSIQLQSLPDNQRKYRSIYKVPGYESAFYHNVEGMQGVSVQGKGKVKLSGNDAHCD